MPIAAVARAAALAVAMASRLNLLRATMPLACAWIRTAAAAIATYLARHARILACAWITTAARWRRRNDRRATMPRARAWR